MVAMGSVLAGVGVLLVALLALLFRHPRAPRWFRSELAAMLISAPVSGFIGFGLGYVLAGGYRLLHGSGHVLELLAPVGVTLLLTFLILSIRRRIAVYAVSAVGPRLVSSAPAMPLSTDPPPRSPAPARPPRRPTHRAA